MNSWITETNKELDNLLRLEQNWDTCEANKINPKSIERAKEVLGCIDIEILKPHVVPLSDGNVQLEWHSFIGIAVSAEMVIGEYGVDYIYSLTDDTEVDFEYPDGNMYDGFMWRLHMCWKVNALANFYEQIIKQKEVSPEIEKIFRDNIDKTWA